jgi:lipopolysaccharide assembly outer membrane protein LptD (OstA)
MATARYAGLLEMLFNRFSNIVAIYTLDFYFTKMKQKSIRFVKDYMVKKGFVLCLMCSFIFSQDKLFLKQADTLTSSTTTSETITKLDGNIIFQKTDTILKGSFANQSNQNSIINLYGDVSVEQPNQTIYCDSLSYDSNTEFFSMYGHIKIKNGSRLISADKATLDQTSNQIILLENCEINEQNNNKVYGDKIILDFQDESLHALQVLSNGVIISKNSGYEKIDNELHSVENEDILKGQTIIASFENDEIENIEIIGMASSLIHLYNDSLYDGINEVSGDKIILDIQNNSARKLIAEGGTIGRYIPNASNQNIQEEIGYSADRVEFEVEKKISEMYGVVKILHDSMDLSAAHINVDWSTNVLEAFSNNPFNNEEVNKPILIENNREPMTGDTMVYNIKSRKGKVLMGESRVQENVYMGSQITSVTDSTFYIDDCIFTSCDPSKFYLGSKQVKIIYGDKVIAKPLSIFIGGVPIIGIPIAIFPHSSNERRSGWIMPSFGSSENRGNYLDGLGYYFAINDYIGSENSLIFADRQGLILKSKNIYKDRYRFNGMFNFEIRKHLGEGESDIAQIGKSNKTDYSFNWNHNQILRDNQTFRGSASYYSNGEYNRETSIDPIKRLNQQAISNVTYTKRWKAPNISISVNASNKQDLMSKSKVDTSSSFYQTPSSLSSIITEDTSTLPSINLRVARRKLFKNKSQDSWLGNIQWDYNSRIVNNSKNFYEAEESIDTDGNITYKWKQNTSGNPESSNKLDAMLKNAFSINAPFTAFKYLAINPSIRMNSDFVNRYRVAEYDDVDTLSFRYEDAIKNRTTGNLGLSLSTKIYGILPIRFNKIQSVRHVMTPSIRFNFSPDYLSNESYFQSFNDEYYDYFSNSIIGSTPTTSTKKLSFSLSNVFQAKIKDKDKEEKINILSWGISSGYNFNAEQFKVSNISSSLRSNLKNGVSIDAHLTHDLYKFDDSTQTRLNELDNFPRLTGVRLATNFILRSKTNSSEEGSEKKFSDGTKEFLTDLSSSTWQSKIGISYTVNKINPSNTIENFWVNTNTSVNVTQNWKLNYNARFSISDKDIVRHNITLYREIDCWELFMDWTPTGYAKGLYFRLNLKSDILKDLKVEQKTGLYKTRSSF